MSEVIGIVKPKILLDSGEVIEKPLDGGWYDGRQYYKGRLGKKGVIITPNTYERTT
jgi:hypothetical protein